MRKSAGDDPFSRGTSGTEQDHTLSHELGDPVPLLEKLADSGAPSPSEGESDASQATGADLPGMYLREVGRIPLLSREQEVELAQALEAGLQAEARLKGDSVSLEEAERLNALVRQGQRAREQFTSANLRLVVAIARRYMQRGVPFLDLIQEGSIGLLRAVEKFDWRRGYKFSTYATWWIRQAITRAIAEQARTIRVPLHALEAALELRRVRREHIHEHGTPPSYEELARLLGTSVARVKELDKATSYTTSLERPLAEDEEETMGDLLPDASVPSPPQEALRAEVRRELHRALAGLSHRERDVLELRYGLRDGHSRTLNEVALVFDISRERVRQIELKALAKLQHPSQLQALYKMWLLLSRER